MKTELDIEARWESGLDHHPRSRELYNLIEKINYLFGGDSLGLCSGGDGDNGEDLMYALDIIFEAEDNGETAKLKRKLRDD